MKNSCQQHRLSVLYAYADWIRRMLETPQGSELYYGNFVTLMFDHIPGNEERRTRIMFDEAERLYSTLVCHLVRNPRSEEGRKKLPKAIFALDGGGSRKKVDMSTRAVLADLNVNGGLHLHGIMLVPTETRLRESIKMHFDRNSRHHSSYVRDDRPLRRIHVEPIRSTPEIATDYALKSLKEMVDLDNILVLPKSQSELSNRSYLRR
jgi:hypothetical protein